MNLLLLRPDDLVTPEKAEIFQEDRRFKHLSAILKKTEVGSELKVGLLGGKLGTGKILNATDSKVSLSVNLESDPPPPLPVKLVISLPRPKVVLRVLQSATTLGVKEIFLSNAYKVEKDFWSCEQLKPASLEKALLLGLEQARDTVLPKVYLERRLKPFVEDQLQNLSQNTNRILAHPSPNAKLVGELRGAQTIVIGPEGGFIPYEVEMIQAQGFEIVSLGPRILKSETAMVSLLSRVSVSYPLRNA